MYPIPPSETLIETKTCKHCSAPFPITDKDMESYDKVSPTFGGKKYQIPTPTLCPDCRQQRRLSFRNERKLYKRKCDATGKDIVSIYSPTKDYAIYNRNYWHGDAWDGLDYEKNYSKDAAIFDQFHSLLLKVPRSSIIGESVENSEYTNDVGVSKNMYLSFNGGRSEDLYYCDSFLLSKDNIDCDWVIETENSYECYRGMKLYGCRFTYYSSNCHDCEFCYSCIGCESCFMCTNLTNKKYCIENIPYSKEEFELKRNSFYQNTNREKSLNLKKLVISHSQLFSKNQSAENILGDDILGGINGKYVYDSYQIKDCAYSINIMGDSIYDSYNSGGCENILESVACYHSSMLAYSSNITNGTSIYYSEYCLASSNLFLCTGLRNKSYCILNKQYTKEEYEELVPQIIEKMMADGEWGEFFPSSMSPFGYNETVAQEHFPLTREEITESGIFNWSDYEAPFPTVEKVIPASKLPDSIDSIPDDILNWAIECEVTGRPFRIIRQELEFYRKHSLPIPRRHPDQRHLDRMALRNPRKLYERQCDKCGVDMITTYAPERLETVYCEECYNREVLG